MTEVSVFLMNKEWSTLNYREKVMVNKYDANFSYHCRLACFNPYRDLTKWQIWVAFFFLMLGGTSTYTSPHPTLQRPIAL